MRLFRRLPCLRITGARARRASLTAPESGNTSRISGSITTTFAPSAYRAAVTPRLPPRSHIRGAWCHAQRTSCDGYTSSSYCLRSFRVAFRAEIKLTDDAAHGTSAPDTACSSTLHAPSATRKTGTVRSSACLVRTRSEPAIRNQVGTKGAAQRIAKESNVRRKDLRGQGSYFS